MGILITNLTKSFKGNIIFNGFSCELPDTGVVRISGPSGAGKTTFLRIIAGLDRDYGGSVVGADDISFAFQEYRLFPWLSAIDNVLIASFESATEQNKDLAISMLSRLGIDEKAMLLKPSKLSGGMKQRISLARAFLRKSKVLILDEPTKELDPALVSIVADLIEESGKERLVLLVSHDEYFDKMSYVTEIEVPQR